MKRTLLNRTDNAGSGVVRHLGHSFCDVVKGAAGSAKMIFGYRGGGGEKFRSEKLGLRG